MIVTVIKTFSDFGHSGTAGDRIDVTHTVAAVLHRRGYISVSDGAYKTASFAVTSKTEESIETPRRRYRRRDMTAENSPE